jgi:hypothetical protein
MSEDQVREKKMNVDCSRVTCSEWRQLNSLLKEQTAEPGLKRKLLIERKKNREKPRFGSKAR